MTPETIQTFVLGTLQTGSPNKSGVKNVYRVAAIILTCQHKYKNILPWGMSSMNITFLFCPLFRHKMTTENKVMVL
jgi:hypothetical protein